MHYGNVMYRVSGCFTRMVNALVSGQLQSSAVCMWSMWEASHSEEHDPSVMQISDFLLYLPKQQYDLKL